MEKSASKRQLRKWIGAAAVGVGKDAEQNSGT